MSNLVKSLPPERSAKRSSTRGSGVGLSDRGLIDSGLEIPANPNGTITLWNRDNGGCPLGMLHRGYNALLLHHTQLFFNLLSQKVRDGSGLQELGFGSFIHLQGDLDILRVFCDGIDVS